MINNNSSPFNGLVPVILVLVLIGGIAALALSGSDLTNFITNSAKAKGLTQQLEVQAQKDAIDLSNYKALQDSQAQAQAAKTLAEAEAYQRSLEQQAQFQLQQNQRALDFQRQEDLLKLEASRFTRMALPVAGALAVLVLSLGGAVCLVQIGRSRVMSSRGAAKTGDVWQDNAWKRNQIALARQQERLERSSVLPSSQSETELSIPVEIPLSWQGKVQEPIEKPMPTKRGNSRNPAAKRT
jgi:hypothetical protein